MKTNQKGFTILELLIATTVFSVILLIATTGIIRIGNMYYKGITTSKTQEALRGISSEIASSIQLANGSKTNVSATRFCLGDNRYTYFLNNKYTRGSETTSGLYYETLTPGSSCSTCSGSCVLDARQMLADNMRLLSFSVNSLTGSNNKVWNVFVKVAYGDTDLLTNYNATAAQNADPVYLANVNCRSGIAGSNFCATAQLDTTIKKRLE